MFMARGTGDRSPANFSVFNIMPMVVAWKELTSNSPRPPRGGGGGTKTSKGRRRGAALDYVTTRWVKSRDHVT